MEARVRALTPDDAEALADLMAAIEADHPTNLQLSAEEIRATLEFPGLVVEGAWYDDRPVAWSGYAMLPVTDRGRRVMVFGDSHPDHQGAGLGTSMSARALAAARAAHASQAPEAPVTFSYRMGPDRPEQADLLAALGFAPAHVRFTMLCELAGLAPAAAPDWGDYALEVLDRADSERIHRAHEVAFAEHPTAAETSPELWSAYITDAPDARLDLSWWVRHVPTGEVAAYLLTKVYDVPLSGRVGVRECYLPYLGTLPAHRGQGLMRRLLRHALGSWQRAGFDTATLEVDAANRTGAIGFYLREGFEVLHSFEEWTLTETPR